LDMQHPLIESVALPLVVGFAVTGVLWAARGGGNVARLASVGVAIGFLLAVHLIVDGLVWLPRTALQKLPYIVAGALLVGLGLEALPNGRRFLLLAGTGALALALLWLAWPQLERAKPADLGILGLCLLAGVTVLGRLAPVSRKCRVAGPVMLILAALGAAGAAFNAGSLVLFQLGLALAAAVGSFVLWNWPRSRLVFGPAGMLAGTVGLLAIIASMLMLSGIRPWALVPLLPVFFTDRMARYLPVPGRLDREAVEAVYVVVLSLPLLAAAVLLAAPAPGTDDLYYY
jgi:hypothetical protein